MVSRLGRHVSGRRGQPRIQFTPVLEPGKPKTQDGRFRPRHRPAEGFPHLLHGVFLLPILPRGLGTWWEPIWNRTCSRRFSTMHRVSAIAVVLVLAELLAGGLPRPVSALDCGSFAAQEDAQAVFDANPGDRFGLDPDGNGVACDDIPARSGQPATID